MAISCKMNLEASTFNGGKGEWGGGGGGGVYREIKKRGDPYNILFI